jgi:hypothetical protein
MMMESATSAKIAKAEIGKANSFLTGEKREAENK